jgi:hypothetical protein
VYLFFVAPALTLPALPIPCQSITIGGGLTRPRPMTEAETIRVWKLREAINELRRLHHVFQFGHYEPHQESLFAQCVDCGQIVYARMNPLPKPWIFGRRAWQELHVWGLPTTVFCGFSASMARAFNPDDPYR